MNSPDPHPSWVSACASAGRHLFPLSASHPSVLIIMGFSIVSEEPFPDHPSSPSLLLFSFLAPYSFPLLSSPSAVIIFACLWFWIVLLLTVSSYLTHLVKSQQIFLINVSCFLDLPQLSVIGALLRIQGGMP